MVYAELVIVDHEEVGTQGSDQRQMLQRKVSFSWRHLRKTMLEYKVIYEEATFSPSLIEHMEATFNGTT